MVDRNSKRRAGPLRAAFFSLFLFAIIVCLGLIYSPGTPLPNGWNPTKPLSVADEVTPITGWKLSQVTADPLACVQTLSEVAEIKVLPTFESSDTNCFITTPVEISRVGDVQMSGVRTSCPTALRLAMWERHTLQPSARIQLGTSVHRIEDLGSYSCRAIRTSQGIASRMSSHATASAIDVSGFVFANGDRANLIEGWQGSDNVALFLRSIRDGACDWFPLTLSPDYNDLHADHFHLQATGWGLCR